MTSRRKIELILGFITVVLAVVATVMGVNDDYEVALRLGEPFSWQRELLFYSGLIVLPAVAVGVGACAHAIKHKVWGCVLIVIGGLVLAWPFVLLFAPMFYVSWIGVVLLLATAAALTIIASFVTANEPVS